MKGIRNNPIMGPRANAGITSFAGISGGGGPQISPKVLVGLCVGFIAIELLLNMLS